jgi:chondroitin-sulfate-ABC endolyase/exolyase
MGNMMYEKIRVGGYIHSVFLMRNELGADRLAREVNTINWYSLLGSANMPFKHAGENADMIRTMVMAKLYAAILQPDVNKRITALNALTAYYNNAFSAAPGYSETFKPDFSGYHHFGPFLGAYYSDAIYAASLICYLLHDTPYALSEATYSNLKQCLLNIRLYCGNYDVPSSANARFPNKTTMLNEIIPAYAYMALAKSTPDAELLGVFSKYWKPKAEPMKSVISRAGIDITQKRTLGEIELCLTAAKLAVPAEKPVKTSYYMPYAGLLVNRGIANLVTVDGYSKYVAGFESVFPNDNLYGRYLHFGQIEYTSLTNGRKNNAYNHKSWDWNRIPGTTSKHLNKKDLYYLTTGSHRVFGDQTFLGGAAMNDSTSVFSFKLHDNMFDKSFYANKSVFCFGNVLICLGSNITTNSTNAPTETTLLQQEFNEGESFKVNGKELEGNLLNLSSPVISDNLGNRFIVKSGKVDVFKTDSFYTAIIDHGFAPKNQEYCYYMLIQSNNKQEAKFSTEKTNPIRIIRQDSIAHIVNNKETDLYAYSIFNATTDLNDSWIKQVNSPSIVLIKKNDKTTTRIVITDPDFRRPEFKGGSLPSESAQSVPFKYAISLNGVYKLKSVNPDLKLSVEGNTTRIEFITVEGKSYTFDLAKIVE